MFLVRAQDRHTNITLAGRGRSNLISWSIIQPASWSVRTNLSDPTSAERLDKHTSRKGFSCFILYVVTAASRQQEESKTSLSSLIFLKKIGLFSTLCGFAQTSTQPAVVINPGSSRVQERRRQGRRVHGHVAPT